MNKLFLWIAAASAIVLQSCEKTDGIQDEIDSLRDRVAALESKVGQVNSGIEALRLLMDESTVIVGVTLDETEKEYVIEFSDKSGTSTSCSVLSAEKIDAVVPMLGIDKETGYWTISLDGGQNSSPLLVDGKEVSAWPVAGGEHQENATGVTPQLRVTNDGYWEVNLGNDWETLLQDDKPVNAVGNNVSYSTSFESVVYDEENKELTVRLLNSEEELTLPVFSLDLEIVTDQSDGPVVFYLEQVQEFTVIQTNVAEAKIQAPKGWSAELEETTLTVTAPAQAQAESEFTLSIIITSKEGYLKIVPLKMQLLNTIWNANACKAWVNFENRNGENVLLDFSYAGYKHGEVAPPDVWGLGYKVYDVSKREGFDPTGQTSSRAAFIALLKELHLYRETTSDPANPTANAIIYFPAGDYVLHDESDDVKRDTPLVDKETGKVVAEYKSSDIIIQGGNFIIKGAGRDKTRLIMKTKNYPATADMWSSPTMINIKNNSSRIGTDKDGNEYPALATVMADAAKGTFSVEVGSAAKIKAGDWVMLYLQSNNPDLVTKELAPKSVDQAAMTDIKTICVYDYHQVKSVSGNTVTFYEPIMHEVEAQYDWQIREFPHYENVGVEDLTFVGDAKEDFGHHASWEDDGAFKPIQMMRLTNSWMRRVDFEHVSEAMTFAEAANCSAYDINITGNRGHSAVRAQASSRVFIGKVLDQTSGKECLNSSGDNLGGPMDNAGQYHASGVSNQSMGTVLWNNTWGLDAMFESHSRQPRATLVDRCTGGFVQWRFGGDESNVPNHLRDLTIWNLNATKVKHDFKSVIFKWWLSEDKWWKIMPPIIVGFHGVEPVDFGSYSETAGGWVDENGELQTLYLENNDNNTPVEPLSLYEAQLYLRLGYVPGWLNSLK